ncbi:hypothetical protein TNCV_2322921 [Trichonephila clavipes]|nr:hypothetical protein TNCV_2322921 [Trichonephila clavipes]
MISETQRMPGKHSPDHNAPASSLDRSGNGCRVVPFQRFHAFIRQRPSVRWSINAIHLKTLPVATQWTSSCCTGVQILASSSMNSSQHRCIVTRRLLQRPRRINVR